MSSCLCYSCIEELSAGTISSEEECASNKERKKWLSRGIPIRTKYQIPNYYNCTYLHKFLEYVSVGTTKTSKLSAQAHISSIYQDARNRLLEMDVPRALHLPRPGLTFPTQQITFLVGDLVNITWDVPSSRFSLYEICSTSIPLQCTSPYNWPDTQPEN